ncbi:EAL domain-containing protein [Leptolyngbya sp. AN02str]|uniref:putative bifunctional diguanylate cyclase/phosphodiesterase n=1 Tax=Leptolyngbya sp. AN02str TaxID=3423363 RepID=UPI003D3212FD
MLESGSQFCDQPSQLTHLSEHSDLFICHELRTPLTSIQGVLGLLNTGKLGCLSEEGQRLLAIAINNANRLNRLARTLEAWPTSSMTVLSEEVIEQLQLENDLHKALFQQEFQLAYQPIISTIDHQIIGFEALARWHHPSRGYIPAQVFIPLAEKLGCIHQLGAWILEQACLQLRTWQQQQPNVPPLYMSVNLSAGQILQPHLVQEIQHILIRTGVLPSDLKIEITESMLVENQQSAICVLTELQEMGIQFYVDDFGTGYSSLGRLQQLPIDGLKIDRSFVQNKQWNISRTIVCLAENLGLDVIAEGVETDEDLMELQAAGCVKMQGYHFSQPLFSQAATTLILGD